MNDYGRPKLVNKKSKVNYKLWKHWSKGKEDFLGNSI